jgi:hypothetical protein
MNPKLKSVLLMTAIALASAVAFWLLQDHLGHALAFAPFLLFLSCPLMHLFMHHGHHHGHDGHDSTEAGPPRGP